MLRALVTRLMLLAALATGASACVLGAKLREDAKLIEQKVATARGNGAYRCAPGELARAEAHLDFLSYELDEGDYRRAEWHHRAALENVNRALELTNPDECADKRVIISDDKPLVITRTDRDGDGITDDVDQCPDEPEDPDQFQDEDGCPDPDNDADSIVDRDDKCPNEPGPATNAGCPVLDRDADGVADDTDKCPEQPGIVENEGCPDTDTDADTLVDRLDKCPSEPEDGDSFQDEDGCPDPDNDADTVLDAVDGCPLEAGPTQNSGCPIRDRDADGVTDDVDQCPDVPGPAPRGCPKKVLVVKTDKQIQIKRQINFETNRAKIKGPMSFEIINQVAAVLKSNPEIEVVIEGHTDSIGDAAYNLKLSDDRAQAVRLAIIDRGVDGGRLEAIGYGESKPIASNKTKRGRAKNRRVEFNIVEQKPEAAVDPGALPPPALP